MSGGCRSLPLLLPPISLQSLEALCLRTFILSFLLLLNKEQQSFKTTEGCRPRKRKAAFAGILGGALPSNHEKLPPKPRVDFPQTTCRFPQTTCRFPQTTSRFPSNHESISLKPRKPPINGLKRDLQGIQVRLWWRRSAAKESTVGSWRETRSAASLKPRISFPQTTSPPHYTCKWLRKTRR